MWIFTLLFSKNLLLNIECKTFLQMLIDRTWVERTIILWLVNGMDFTSWCLLRHLSGSVAYGNIKRQVNSDTY